MNKWFTGRTRRERFYLLAGIGVLVFGFVIYPLFKRTAASRTEKKGELEQLVELRSDYQSVLESTDEIKAENERLAGLMSSTEGFLFERTGNNVMMEASMTRLFNQFGPELKLDISEARASLRNDSNQIHYSIKGSGRYPDILKFIYQVEVYRPFIVIDTVQVAASAQGASRRRGGGARRPPSPPTDASETVEPNMKLKLEIHINCSSPEEES